MANLNKKSKPGNKGDFAKTRQKVGRVKVGAVNATDTSFQARRLNVRTQALSTAQKVAAYARGAALEKESLLARLQPHLSICTGHPSGAARREAFTGMLQKCREASEEQLKGALLLLSEAIGPGLVDREESVRMAALALASFLLRAVRTGPIVGETLMPFILLAGSHIDQGVQRDGVRFLERILHTVPQVLPAWIGRIFGSFSGGRQNVSSLLLSILDYHLQVRERQTVRSNETAVSYVWQGEQRVSLAGVRLRRSAGTEPVTLGEVELVTIIRWLGTVMLRVYGEVAPRLKNLRLPGAPTSEERAQLAAFNAHAERLRKLIFAEGWDQEGLMNTLPAALRVYIIGK